MGTDETASFGYLSPDDSSLFTDRDELTMLRGYRDTGHAPRATFSLFYRSLPESRGDGSAIGTETVDDRLGGRAPVVRLRTTRCIRPLVVPTLNPLRAGGPTGL